MNSTNDNTSSTTWKLPTLAWIAFIASGALLAILFHEGIRFLLRQWDSPEYGYAYLIPVITAFLIWQKKDLLEKMPFIGSWTGLGVTLIGILLFFLGELSALHVAMQYALLVVIAGMILAFTGRPGFRVIWVPVLLLVFIVPLPGFLYQELSGQLQLISSQLGVWVIRLFGISVFLEGNVIDLGSFKLQVVEACNGLRYLFPLMTLGFIAAYFYKAAFWKRAVIFLSTIPITILMNSFRIGMIGVAVEYWGKEMAEGLLHDFEGWVVFMASLAVMVLEMWLFTKLGKDTRPFQEIFGLELPGPSPNSPAIRSIPKPFIAAAFIVLAATMLNITLPERVELTPSRQEFATFPLNLGSWQGRGDRLEPIYIDALNFDDYILANFTGPQQQQVNLFISYYATQRSDKVPHSPRACIPGGGWEITDIGRHHVKGIHIGGNPLWVNRTIIQKGEHKQLVYYWFQQRGRTITSEYLVKWYLFWDALTLNRTDGALVRFVTFIEPGRSMEEADDNLRNFAGEVASRLETYIPN